MKVLHIVNDFSWSHVHRNLYSELDNLGIVQKIFVPLRSKLHIGVNIFDFKTESSAVAYSSLLKGYHRVLFRWKINRLTKDVKKRVDLSEISLIHSTTLFSDGAVALNLHKRYNIPYVVTVRNTDVFTFLKYRPDLSNLAHTILSNASKIVFISKANMTSFYNHKFIRSNSGLYQPKSIVINNGIDPYWLTHVSAFKSQDSDKLIFVGRFDTNKNVLNLIKAIDELRSEIPTLTLSLVGGGGDKHGEVIRVASDREWITYLGKVTSKVELSEILRSHSIFAMISIHETFGLVYVEALSQGLPILYTKDQGIDGTITSKIGEGVDPTSISEIKIALYTLIKNRDQYKLDNVDFSKFNWSNIAKEYSLIYKSILTS